ncbi:biliverdin-producing heme oxygenase [Pseudomonas sp. ES3-33]|uniref:biliverdin-producing heme oxygenase n=1 Tax=Pseudomonas sp. ES3-33 TaxID=1628833 RepID=UPI0005D34B26|nr:biliverdin-producing heme oxygenase [Pseudomonas sp. ES3-33]KJH78446.1 heme oxygenase [Pseudomonas sp. ES3-33]
MNSVVGRAAVCPLLQYLRSGTGTLHIALEKRLPFFSPALDLAHYRRIIQAYCGFYKPLERRLLEHAEILSEFGLADRLKTPTLCFDLLALGLTESAIADLPQCAALPAITSRADCLGVLYVLEGATLGGQILRREIATRLGLDASTGAAFLEVYGAATGRRWREFIGHLGAATLEAPARDRAVTAARNTFACFESWLDSASVLLPAGE